MSDARFILISGCSGGGKSTLLAELRRRGYRTVKEPGRRIVTEEVARGGSALPWTDPAAFARRAIALALGDREAARDHGGVVFFDRGIVDAASALEAATGEPAVERWCRTHRYDPIVFMAPPWPEIYATDGERRHGFAESLSEHERLTLLFPALGYRVIALPKASIAERADFVLSTLSSSGD